MDCCGAGHNPTLFSRIAHSRSDEQELRSLGLLDEVGGADDALDFFILAVAIAVIPGMPPRPCGMCVAGLPRMVNFRSFIRDLVIMSKPQNVKNRCVSTPSPSAAFARTRPG